ncbi:MAG: cytochrome o ubiquinol oxidase subunit IV [Candidatus Saccharibacteria bacterium]|nr:cytochrome o ubiquinol oxidase subunit IV [Candidatus Saccharibacteria bacterium]
MSKKNSELSTIKYSVGFLLSVLLTLFSYLLITQETFSGWALKLSITGLALLQLLTQLVFFMHINTELKPRWKLLVFIYTVITVVVLVLGSIWIMYNLDYNHGHQDHIEDQSIDEYIIHDEGAHYE